MASVSEIGYLGIGVSDPKAWQETATSIFGMQATTGDDRKTSYLRLDTFHHRLELHTNGGGDLEFAGWEVPDAKTLDSVAGQLEDGGVKVTVGRHEEADQRRVIGLIKYVDPRRPVHRDIRRPPGQFGSVLPEPTDKRVQD